MNPTRPRLYIFVEGSSDKILIERKIVPYIRPARDVVCIPIQNLTKKEVKNLVGAASHAGANYIFLRDQDLFSCFKEAIGALLKVRRYLARDRILITFKSIEAWYVAGLTEDDCKDLRIDWRRIRASTEHVHKHNLDTLRLHNSTLRPAELLVRCLDRFELKRARPKNRSLRKLCRMLA